MCVCVYMYIGTIVMSSTLVGNIFFDVSARYSSDLYPENG